MKLSNLTFGALLLSALTLSSCSDDSFTSSHDDYATLHLSLTPTNSLDTGDITRADDGITISEALGTTFSPETFLTNNGDNFNITIEGNEYEYNGTLGNYTDQIKYGAYTVKATYDPKTVGFYEENGGDPSFGSQSITFAINQPSAEVQVPVSLSNSILRVKYTDMFKNYFEKCETKVKSIGNDTEVTFLYDDTKTPTTVETRGAFFIAASATITYTLTPRQAQDTNDTVKSTTITKTLSPKTCYTLQFDVTDVGGVQELTVDIIDEPIATVDAGEIDINDDQYKPSNN